MGISRLNKLQQILDNEELDALFISHSENRRYLSGFTGSEGWLLISRTKALLAVDFRYIEQANNETTQFEITIIRGEIAKWLPELISELGIIRLGFESDNISFAVYHQLYDAFHRSNHEIKLVPTSNLVESIRMVKEPEEIDSIIKAAVLADTAMVYAKSILSPGVAEVEIAWKLEKFLREKGSESLPFDVIVASGSNSALPHASPSHREILKGEPIVIDIGARVDGYCSDLSRTFFLGEKNATFRKIYDITLGAQLVALATIKSGNTGEQADEMARTVISQANYGDNFGHGLGHGVGLAVHESPRIAPSSKDKLIDGMVFTIEPGIYISAWGGIRIEDTVVLKNGNLEILTKSSK